MSTSTARVFLRSLRIDQDHGSPAIAKSYILTSNALRATQRILQAIESGVGGAWTLVGPFGTGKSAFCLYLAHLLGAHGGEACRHALQQLRHADAELAKRAFPAGRRRQEFVTLLVSGSPEPISTAILRTISQSATLRHLKASASGHAKAKRLLGASSQQGTTNATARLVNEIADALENRSTQKGLLIVLDELGQFLSQAAERRDTAGVFLLQQLAEMAARSEGRMVVLGVLHQDFREYAAMLPSADRSEWEKIRGRFEDIPFEEPPSQLLRFVAKASIQCHHDQKYQGRTAAENAVKQLAPAIWNLRLAPPGLNRDEGAELFRSCAPLHPLTAVLLGPVYRRVGQNERSAFSFLASDEPTALRAWMQSQSHPAGLYDVVELYNHLVRSLGNALLHTADAKRWAEAFDAELRHPLLSRDAVIALQAIAFLGIASRWYAVSASQDVLRYALSARMVNASIDAALAELKSASVIVHRKYNDSYVVWEGSDVDVEARLEEGRSRLRETVGAAALLDKNYRMQPLLARRHSFETGTLRFFDIRFADSSKLSQVAAEDLTSDGRVVVALAAHAPEAYPSLDDLKRFNTRTLILVVPPLDSLANLALEMAALEWTERHTPELNHDGTAMREVKSRKGEVNRQLRHLLDQLLATRTEGARWFHSAKAVSISDRRQLNELLSTICDKEFRHAPRIDNEIINRQDLSSSAAAARRNLVERMILHGAEEGLGLQGNPPERSIYRSLLSDEGLGLHRCHQKVWGFRFPPSSQREQPRSGFKLFEAIDEFLSASSASPRPVSALFDLLRKPPFGLRDGPVPVLVCSALLAKEAEVALYKQGEFQPSMSPALFEDLIKHPNEFAVRQLRISGVQTEIFEKLGLLLGQLHVAKQSTKQQVVTIARLLIRFTRSLPDYVQVTSGVSQRSREVREVLLRAREPETMLLTDLPKAVGVPPFKGNDRKRSKDVESYISHLKLAIVELRDCFPKLTAGIWQSLGEAFGLQASPDEIRSALRDRASTIAEFAVERDMRMLIDRMRQDSASSDDWLDGVASFLGERLPTKWRDEDLAHFGMRLRQFVRRFTLLEATIVSRPKNANHNGAESIRIALTSTRLGQFDDAIYLDPRNEDETRAIETKLDAVLNGSDRRLVIAALCRLLHRHAAGNGVSDAHREPEFEGNKHDG